MSEELKKCPFCGSSGWIAKWNISSYWSIGCNDDFNKCGFRPNKINYYITKEAAIAAWNRRAK